MGQDRQLRSSAQAFDNLALADSLATTGQDDVAILIRNYCITLHRLYRDRFTKRVRVRGRNE